MRVKAMQTPIRWQTPRWCVGRLFVAVLSSKRKHNLFFKVTTLFYFRVIK